MLTIFYSTHRSSSSMTGSWAIFSQKCPHHVVVHSSPFLLQLHFLVKHPVEQLQWIIFSSLSGAGFKSIMNETSLPLCTSQPHSVEFKASLLLIHCMTCRQVLYSEIWQQMLWEAVSQALCSPLQWLLFWQYTVS